ncbi:MAG TPA: SDR family NAD(P)-dependent oxidoreductase [Candidatus Bathyarchaeota archaeon]|nr:SDR family NAD(P)-dependent oxidoreductase [Candidatus Bathyarchaeota archaeon]
MSKSLDSSHKIWGITLKDLAGKQVVVTGGAGFIGSNLCRTLLEQDAKVTAYDNLYSGKIEHIEDLMDKGLNFVQQDIRDTAALENATKNSEVIFHLAAQTSVPFSMKNPKEDSEINVVGTLNVLEAARKADARMVFSSSCAVYGNPERPTPETHPTHPIAFYGLSKLLGENCCRFYQEIYGLEIVILRIFNVYGPDCHGVMYDFLNKLQKTPDKLEILGTGRQSRDFVYISDMVDFLLKAATSSSAAGEVFNVGTGVTTSVSELAKMIIEILELKDVEVSFTGGQAWEGDMDITLADNSKAVNMLQWRPQVSLKEGLKKLISSGKY